MATRCIRTACWITKTTNTHSEYATLIAFPLQQRLHERASVLRYTYIACLAELLDSAYPISCAHKIRTAILPITSKNPISLNKFGKGW